MAFSIVKIRVRGCADPYNAENHDIEVSTHGVFKKGYNIHYDDEKKKYWLPDKDKLPVYMDSKQDIYEQFFKELSEESIKMQHVPAWKRWTVRKMMGGVRWLIDIPPEYRHHWDD